MSMPSASMTARPLVGVPAPRVQVVGISQRVAELLVLVHARVAEPGEAHRDGDVVLHQHLLGADAVVVAHPWSAFTHRRGKFALPEVDRLAHVAISVDHHVRAAARELPHFPHRCSPRNRTPLRIRQRRRDTGVNDVLVIGSERRPAPAPGHQHPTGLRRRPARLRRLVCRARTPELPGRARRRGPVPAGPLRAPGAGDGGTPPRRDRGRRIAPGVSSRRATTPR